MTGIFDDNKTKVSNVGLKVHIAVVRLINFSYWLFFFSSPSSLLLASPRFTSIYTSYGVTSGRLKGEKPHKRLLWNFLISPPTYWCRWFSFRLNEETLLYYIIPTQPWLSQSHDFYFPHVSPICKVPRIYPWLKFWQVSFGQNLLSISHWFKYQKKNYLFHPSLNQTVYS